MACVLRTAGRPYERRSPARALCLSLPLQPRAVGDTVCLSLLLVITSSVAVCADGRKPCKRAALGASMLHMLTCVLHQAHSFWGHSAALDLQELAAAARRARAAADAAESSVAQPAIPADAAPPEEFACLQARAARHVRAAKLPCSRLPVLCARSPRATVATPRCCSVEWAAERQAACARMCTRCVRRHQEAGHVLTPCLAAHARDTWRAWRDTCCSWLSCSTMRCR